MVAGYLRAERGAPQYHIATLLHGNPHGLCKVASHCIASTRAPAAALPSLASCIAMRTHRAMPWHVVISAWSNCCCLVSRTVTGAGLGGTLG